MQDACCRQNSSEGRHRPAAVSQQAEPAAIVSNDTYSCLWFWVSNMRRQDAGPVGTRGHGRMPALIPVRDLRRPA